VEIMRVKLMKEMLKNLLLDITGNHRAKNTLGRKPRGQSLVEIAIAFPFIIILLSGVVEMGFIINEYLSLLDATREAARFYSNGDPNADPNFYANVAAMVDGRLKGSDLSDPLIELDPTRDDVVVTAIAVHGDTGVIDRYPGGTYYQLYGNSVSGFTDTEIENLLIADAPNSGVLLVEVYFGYEEVLNLPWLDPFFPEPLMLHAYTVMPLIAVEPD
jgi:hypothetical protein